jgi:phosphoribosylaminoimidazolecarboxamide formyltransferase / IMP cyclohydrolase
MPRALLSVYNKSGIVEFAGGLQALGWDLLATGGTASLLHSKNIPVIEVSEYTGSPEILNGRVKTLHPAIEGGILARSTEKDLAELTQFGWKTIDLVVVNLYPFEEVIKKIDAPFEEIIENIDIGGVTLIRAAAKNFERVTLVCDPEDYPKILAGIQANNISLEMRRQLAVKGFSKTYHYDHKIFTTLSGQSQHEVTGFPSHTLRYGENPHQSAVYYSYRPGEGPLGGHVIQGKELSYNNLLDLDAAWKAVVQFDSPSICIVKHLSPCGIASAENLAIAYHQAFASDPVSAFGGVISCNRTVDGETAAAMQDLFIECIVAPGFSPEALAVFTHKKNCRVLQMPDLKIEPEYEIRSITRGFLKQAIDFGDPVDADWKVVSQRQPTEQEWKALKFAWKACQYVKSNAIVFCLDQATVGIGGGQPNRVDSVRIAAAKAGPKAGGAVMASDAFFPFPDSIEVAAAAGITAVIHPGGSVRDQESVDAADKANMAMVVTGYRHFRH